MAISLTHLKSPPRWDGGGQIVTLLSFKSPTSCVAWVESVLLLILLFEMYLNRIVLSHVCSSAREYVMVVSLHSLYISFDAPFMHHNTGSGAILSKSQSIVLVALTHHETKWFANIWTLHCTELHRTSAFFLSYSTINIYILGRLENSL